MGHRHAIFLTLSLILLPAIKGVGQIDSTYSNHCILISTQATQFKDYFTYDLVYSGFSLGVGYKYQKISEKKSLMVISETSFGANFNKGTGLAWRFKPIEVNNTFKVSDNNFSIGYYAQADYNWQQYSELQGGRLFWFSGIDFGLMLDFDFQIKNTPVEMSIFKLPCRFYIETITRFGVILL